MLLELAAAILITLIPVLLVARYVLARLIPPDRLLPLARLMHGYDADGWAQGVQEEDRVRPWGRTKGEATSESTRAQ